MRISYVTSHKGSIQDLKRCLNSVRVDCQDLGLDWEHLVALDGYSEDEAGRIKATLNNQNRKIFFSSDNIGKAAWVNRLINESKGDIIYFLDSDDFVIMGKTYQQYMYLKNNAELDCVGSNHLRWDRKNTFIASEYPKNDKDIKKSFWRYPFLLYSSLAIKASSYRKNGLYFRNDLRGGIDYEFYSRLLSNCKVSNLERPLVVYTRSDNGITATRSTRVAQLNAHEDVLKKLFSLKDFDSSSLASLMMKYILNQLDELLYSELRNEIGCYLDAVEQNPDDHRYFNNWINIHELKTMLNEV